MSNKCCVFCGLAPPLVKISKEHVMRAALSKYVLPLKRTFNWKQTYRRVEDGTISSNQRHIPVSAFEWVVNDVCKTCNEGWLNVNIEIPAEPFIAAAMQGKKIALSENASNLISVWAAKTAAIRALMDPQPRAIPSAHYAYIKEHLEPPPNTIVWLAHTEYCHNPFMRHIRLRTIKNPSLPDTSSHYTSIVYGHMAIFVIGASHEHGLQPFWSTISQINSFITLQVWPYRPRPTWPILQIPLGDVKNLSNILPLPGMSIDNQIIMDMSQDLNG